MSKPAPEPAVVALDRRMTEGFNLIHRELAAQRADHAALRALIAEQGERLGSGIERNRIEIHDLRAELNDVRADQRELRGEVRALRRAVWTVMGGTLLLVIGLVLAAALSPALGSLFG